METIYENTSRLPPKQKQRAKILNMYHHLRNAKTSTTKGISYHMLKMTSNTNHREFDRAF